MYPYDTVPTSTTSTRRVYSLHSRSPALCCNYYKRVAALTRDLQVVFTKHLPLQTSLFPKMLQQKPIGIGSTSQVATDTEEEVLSDSL